MDLTRAQRLTLQAPSDRNFIELQQDGTYHTRICLNGDETGTGPHTTAAEAWGAALVLVFASGYPSDPDLAGGLREYWWCDTCQREVLPDHQHTV